jgi:hypothetical protein
LNLKNPPSRRVNSCCAPLIARFEKRKVLRNYSAVVQKTRVFFDRHPGLDPGSCPTGQLPARHAMPEALEIPACAGMTC